MNAIMEVEVVEMELKYCERCGGLWLRERGSDGVYCEGCVAKMAEFPARLKRGPRCERNAPSDLEGVSSQRLAYVCSEGGHA